MPPPSAAAALVDGTFGPSLPGTKPSWLGTGVLVPEPEAVPLLAEYRDPAGPTLPGRRSTEDRLTLKGEFAVKRLSAEKALVMLPELSTDMSMDAGVGAEDAR